MRKNIGLLLIGLIVLIILAGCSSNSNTLGGSDGEKVLTVAISEEPANLDPQIQAKLSSYKVTTQIFDRLVKLDNDMNIVPSLAESWEVIDEKTTEFKLRDDVKFHNGENMTAEDVKFSLERAISNDGVNYNYLIIDDVSVEDDYTVKITTKEPFNAMLERLTLDAAAIVSKKAVKENEEGFDDQPVGTGPFELESREFGGDIVLKAFPDYYDGKSDIDKIIFKVIPEPNNRLIGLKNNELSIAYDLTNTDKEQVNADDNLTLLEKDSSTVLYLGYNVEKDKLNDVKVRKAISHALNSENIVKVAYHGAATVAKNTMLTPYISEYSDDIESYDHDIEKAKELLKEAGYSDGLELGLWVSDSKRNQDTAAIIQEQLRQIDITVDVKIMDQGQYISETSNGDHELFIGEKTSIDADSMLRSMYHSEAFGASGNKSFWASDEIDKKLDEANSSIDEDKVAELYQEIQNIIAKEEPVTPILITQINAGTQTNIKGFGLYPGQTHFIYGTSIE